MQDYNTLFKEFIQYKHFCGYKYKTGEIVLKEIITYLIQNNIIKLTSFRSSSKEQSYLTLYFSKIR